MRHSQQVVIRQPRTPNATFPSVLQSAESARSRTNVSQESGLTRFDLPRLKVSGRPPRVGHGSRENELFNLQLTQYDLLAGSELALQ